MADVVSGHIEVEILEKDSINVSGNGNGHRTSTESRKTQRKQLDFFDKAGTLFKRWLPYLGIGGGIYALVKGSKLMGATMQSLLDIIGAVIDAFIMPLMPIFMKIFEAVAPMIPKFMEMAEAIVGPIVTKILPIIDKILTQITGFFDAWSLQNKEAVEKFTGEKFEPITTPEGPAWTIAPNPEEQESWINRWFKWYNEQIDKAINLADRLPDWLKGPLLGQKQLGGYIPRTGMYMLHRGEEVKTSVSQSATPVIIQNEFNLAVGSAADVDFLVSELERRVTTRLTDIVRRS